jgi:flagella basal body P-ring formation protein FlgA
MTAKLLATGILAIAALAQNPSCLPVEADQIRGSDLARAIPAFKRIPPNTPLAPTPGPGGTRVFTAAELQSVAARFSVSADPAPDLCFQMLTGPLDRERVLEAMQVSLQTPGVQIELLEVSSEKVPRGRIEFPREGLGAPALPDRKSPVLWRGSVVYGVGRQRFAVWGRVNVTAPVSRFVATESLKAGVAIQTNQLRRETIESFPVLQPASDKLALEPEQIVGKLPLRTIAAGAEIRMDNLALPIDVHRGDRVRVEVRIGAAHIALNGRAESNGRIGDMISVRNPDSSKMFRARVESKDQVIVELATAGGQ